MDYCPHSEMTLTADDGFRCLEEVLALSWSGNSSRRLYCLLQEVCNELTQGLHFSNLFTRLDYACRHINMPPAMRAEMQQLRHRLHTCPDMYKDNRDVWENDILLLARFIAIAYGQPIPHSLTACRPAPALPHLPSSYGREVTLCLRVLVRRFDKTFIYASPENGDGEEVLCIDYAHAGYDGELAYLYHLLREGMSINLLKTVYRDDGILLPKAIILLPDCLIDVSSLARCFRLFGNDPRNYILARIEQRTDTPETLLGNAASQFLDDWVYDDGIHPVTYKDSVRQLFHHQPVSFAFTDMNGFDFHEKARQQFFHIRQLVKEEMEQLYGFQLDKALVEPSFVCEALGLSGRMDYLQSDGTKVIEQKSGKRDEWRHSHMEAHFVQMMLYEKIVEYNLQLPETACQGFLFYSRYSDGFYPEKIYNRLLLEALAVRNRIVIQEMQCAEGKTADILRSMTPDSLNTTGNKWAQKMLEQTLLPLSSSQLTFSYITRFYTFLCREQMLGKTGMDGETGNSFSDLWNLPPSVRMANGDMYAGLSLIQCLPGEEASGAGIERLVFHIHDCSSLTNFRKGDIVLVYGYPQKGVPDVRRGLVMRGKLADMEEERLEVVLNHRQRNTDFFPKDGICYALEHDRIESSNEGLYRGLFALANTNSKRRELILGLRPPEHADHTVLAGDYGSFNRMVSKEVAAKDYFLIIGPPGSGKTNCALRYMVEEELRRHNGHILLMAYTNRAVDEICSMLELICQEHPDLMDDYLNMGKPLTTSPLFHKRLLSRKCEKAGTAAEVRALLEKTRIYVGTTSTMSSHTLLLKNIHFKTAFIDEASQILEPYLLPLLCSQNADTDSIERFVLIGDQKQLPAVVLQDTESSQVKEPELLSIGLTNCRNSLFERLLKQQQTNGLTASYEMLTRQGRMHPDVYAFVNNNFYNGLLQSVPLSHQIRPLSHIYARSRQRKDLPPLCSLLANHRMLFVDCPPSDTETIQEKANASEAELTARLIEAYSLLLKMEKRPVTEEEIGVIVPYRNQISMIRSKLELRHYPYTHLITIDTVERFQGSQRNLIICSLTVTRPHQLQFLTSSTYLEGNLQIDRKLNVALTRSREQTLIVGHAALLQRNILYKRFIQTLKEQGHYFPASDLPEDIPLSTTTKE